MPVRVPGLRPGKCRTIVELRSAAAGWLGHSRPVRDACGAQRPPGWPIPLAADPIGAGLSRTAAAAWRWISARPGSEAALAAGLVHVLLEKNRCPAAVPLPRLSVPPNRASRGDAFEELARDHFGAIARAGDLAPATTGGGCFEPAAGRPYGRTARSMRPVYPTFEQLKVSTEPSWVGFHSCRGRLNRPHGCGECSASRPGTAARLAGGLAAARAGVPGRTDRRPDASWFGNGDVRRFRRTLIPPVAGIASATAFLPGHRTGRLRRGGHSCALRRTTMARACRQPVPSRCSGSGAR